MQLGKDQFDIIPLKDKIVLPDNPTESFASMYGGWKAESDALSMGKIRFESDNQRILIGDATEPLTGTGIFQGLDTERTNYDWRVGDPSGQYIHWDGSTSILTIVGTINASAINIPDASTANSFHVDTSGNTWWGATAIGSATAKILNTGAGTFSKVTISGGADVIFISDTLDTSTKKILKDFTFGSSDYSGAFKTGNITWDATTGAITGGSGALFNKNGLIFATNGEATITLDGITGGANFSGTLSAPTGSLGAITTGLITLDTTGYLRGGKTGYADSTNAGFFIGYDTAAYKLYFGTASDTTYLKYDGANFSLYGGTLTAPILQTASSGERIVLTSSTTRLDLINSSGSTVASLNYGSATTAAIMKIAPTNDARRGLEFVVGSTLGSDAKCITIDNPSTSISIDITDGGSTGLNIAGCSTNAITISHAGTGSALDIGANASAATINLAASAYPAIEIAQSGTGSNSYGIRITEGADSLKSGILIDNDATSHVSHCMEIERLADADDQLVAAVVIKSANQGTGGRACGIDFTDATIQGIMNVAADTTAVGTAAGRIPIYVGGTLKYLAYYNA